MPTKPRILATHQFPPAVMDRLLKDYDVITNETNEHLSADVILERSKNVDGIMCSPGNAFDQALIDALPASVKIIATFSVGYDHLDLAAAAKRGIVLGNTPDVLTAATADIALLCLLGAARKAHTSATILREGKWSRWTANQFLGVHVSGKRLGILGMGRIGQAVARRAKGFDMEIHYHNRRPVSEPGLEEAIFHESLDDLLPNCDFLSINCGLSDETQHLINDATIEKLPDGAVLVNTARGAIVDDIALIKALKSGKIAAAGLDVFENEPTLNPEYLDLDNLFVLPHIGSATFETRDAMGFKCLDNLDAFFAGNPIPSPITL
ncbi:MAG: D-glycerate dehydrogenase [Sneathiella sp.]|nr:D-glycerate dehydrogenase [Sneathiella sp.]